MYRIPLAYDTLSIKNIYTLHVRASDVVLPVVAHYNGISCLKAVNGCCSYDYFKTWDGTLR